MYDEIIDVIHTYEHAQTEYLAEPRVTVTRRGDDFVVADVRPLPQHLLDTWGDVRAQLRGAIERAERFVPVSDELRYFAAGGGPLIVTLIAIGNAPTPWWSEERYGQILGGTRLGGSSSPDVPSFLFGVGAVYNDHGSYMAPEALAHNAVRQLG